VARVDQEVVFVQRRDQGRQSTGGYPGGGRPGIQGVGVHAAVETLHHGDLGVAEPVQDDSGVGGTRRAAVIRDHAAAAAHGS